MARIAGVDLPRDKRIEYASQKPVSTLIPAFAISPKKKLLKSVKLLTLIIK